jgi:ubiquinone/menaquinone biosynthesis C-methylase UbiE
MAVDAAVNMLEIARYNIEIASLIDRIQLDHVDGKRLPHENDRFAAVISNSIVHHIPEPMAVLHEAVRVTAPGGSLFFRDLFRPADENALQQIVKTYAGQENEHQQKMFADSLRAALTVDEMRDLVVQLGFTPETVQATSDRHWTWIAAKGQPV